MSALLIPFPVSCRVRTAEAQKRISRAFKRIADAGTAETPDERWARSVEVVEAIDAVKSKRVPPSTTPASAQPVGPLNLETEMEALAQIIADRVTPGARKATPSPPRPSESDLAREMGPWAERIAARVKQIRAERAAAGESN